MSTHNVLTIPPVMFFLLSHFFLEGKHRFIQHHRARKRNGRIYKHCGEVEEEPGRDIAHFLLELAHVSAEKRFQDAFISLVHISVYLKNCHFFTVPEFIPSTACSNLKTFETPSSGVILPGAEFIQVGHIAWSFLASVKCLQAQPYRSSPSIQFQHHQLTHFSLLVQMRVVNFYPLIPGANAHPSHICCLSRWEGFFLLKSFGNHYYWVGQTTCHKVSIYSCFVW